MKKLLALIAVVGLAFQSFAFDPVNEKLLESFKTSFPNAEQVKWQELPESFVVSFVEENIRARAYYDKDGVPVQLIRATKPDITRDFAKMLHHGLTHPEEHQPEKWQLVAGRGPSPKGAANPSDIVVANGKPSSSGRDHEPKPNGKRAKSGKGGPSANGSSHQPLPTPSAEWEKLIQERLGGPGR